MLRLRRRPRPRPRLEIATVGLRLGIGNELRPGLRQMPRLRLDLMPRLKLGLELKPMSNQSPSELWQAFSSKGLNVSQDRSVSHGRSLPSD